MEKELDRLVISRNELALLLEKNKEYIGRRTLIANQVSIGITTLTTLIVSDFKDILFLPSSLFLGGYAFVTAMMFVWAVLIVKKDKFTHETLLKKIEALSKIENEYRAVLILKDGFATHSNRFLVYSDTVWNCYLCPHYTYDPGNESTFFKSSLSKKISDDIFVYVNDYDVKPIEVRTNVKYSYRTNEMKCYHFYYFRISVSPEDFPDNMRKDEFEINHRKYFWKSIEELRMDENTRELPVRYK